MTRNLKIWLIYLVCSAVFGAVSPVSGQDASPPADAQRYVEKLVSDLISSDGQKVDVFGLSVGITGNVTAERATVSDVDGVWLEITGLSLDWQPLSLFRDTLQVNRLDIQQIDATRWPRQPPTESTSELPEPQPVEIGDVAIARIILAEDFAGTAAELTAQASASITGDPVRVAVNAEIERIDGIAGTFSAKIGYQPGTENLDIDVRGTDGPSGLIGNLMNIPGRPRLDLALTGSGTLDNWNGDISLTTGGSQTVGGEVRIAAVEEGRRVGGALEGSITEFVPAAVRPAFEDRSTLAGSVLIPGNADPIRIETLFLENPAVKIDLSGDVDPSGERTRLQLVARTPPTETNLARLADAGRDVSITDLRIEAGLSGSLANPRWTLTGGAARIAAGPDTVTNLQIAGANEPSAAGVTGFSLRVNANADTQRPAPWANQIRGPVDFTASGVYGPDRPLRLENMRLTTATGRIQLAGSVQPGTGTLDLSIDGEADNLRIGNAFADRLLGGTARVSGRVGRAGTNDPLRLSSLRLAADAIDVSLDGELGSDSLNLTVDGQFPELARLSDRAGGSAAFNASLSGPMDRIAVSLDANGDDVSLSGKPFESAVLNFNGILDRQAPAGRFALSGRYQGAPVRAGFDLRTEANGDRRLTDLEVAMTGAELSGEITVPQNGRPIGSLEFNAPDLETLGDLMLIDLQGSLVGSVDIGAEGSADRALLVATGRDIRANGIVISSLDADVTVPDIKRPSQFVGGIKAAGLSRGDLKLDSLSVTGSAQGNGYALEFDAAGNPLNGTASAVVSTLPDGIAVALNRAAANVYGVPVEIARPTQLRFADNGIVIESSVVNIGSGTIEVGGSYGDSVDLNINASAVPLSVIDAAIGNAGLSGSVSGSARLSGTTQSPEAVFDLTASQATTNAVRQAGIPAIGLSASGTLSDNILSFQAKTAGQTRFELAADGRITIKGDPSLNVTVSGQVPLALIADRLAESGLRAEGTARVSGEITGTAAKPNVSGTIDISGATLGDAEGRFTVTNATARMTANGDRIDLVNLSGDAGGGTFTATGSTSLRSNGPISGKINVRNGRFVDGTLIVARFDADLNISGARGTGILVGGEITLLKTTITLDTLPPAARQLADVRHLYPPIPVARQWALLQQRRSESGATGPRLDLIMRTAKPILVRGRGINADFGGRLNISGTADNVQPTGRFRLLRGTLTIVGRRLDFNRGSLEFTGDINPELDISATSQTRDASVTLTVSGTPDDPTVTISSVPEMPAEEALANLVFQQSSTELSPVQLVRMADAILVLNGGTQSGLFEGLRRAIGIDRIDVNTQSDGTTTVGAGWYLGDRVYLGAEQGIEEGNTKVTIDLDVTRNVKLRTGASSDGETEAGIVFEKEY